MSLTSIVRTFLLSTLVVAGAGAVEMEFDKQLEVEFLGNTIAEYQAANPIPPGQSGLTLAELRLAARAHRICKYYGSGQPSAVTTKPSTARLLATIDDFGKIQTQSYPFRPGFFPSVISSIHCDPKS